jgi:hypothetical protein
MNQPPGAQVMRSGVPRMGAPWTELRAASKDENPVRQAQHPLRLSTLHLT